MPKKDIVVIGTSAGGIEALQRLAAALPEDFTGSLFVVMHSAPDSPGVLAQIIDGAGPLAAANAEHDERIRPGRIYVAPPDHHLLIERGRVKLSLGPRENRFRPAIDPLFRSAAQTYGPRVVGVILTGGLDDGTNGLWTVKKLGGTAVVQDPADAVAPSMPSSAMRHVPIDHCVALDELPALLVRLAATPADARVEDLDAIERVQIEVDIAAARDAKEAGVFALGDPSRYACPECHGVLLRMKNAAPERFRCHTGHAYTLDNLLAAMDTMIEDALWNAIRALDERAMVLRDAKQYALAEETQRRSDHVREVVLNEEKVKARG